MSATGRKIAKELDNRHDGDRGACSICSPRSDRVRHEDLWPAPMGRRVRVDR